MQRQLLIVVLVLGLMAMLASAACADPWPSWENVNGTFSCQVAKAQTSTGWDYTVSVDPDNAYPGWAIGAFAVYADNVTNQKPWFWSGYHTGGNTAGWWTGLGWEPNKYPGPHNTTAAFGWLTAGSLLYSGSSATFHATNLPAGFENWNQHFAVLAFGPADFGARCVELFWAPAESTDEGGGQPQETPEPGSLALLTLGAGAVFGALKRRKTS